MLSKYQARRKQGQSTVEYIVLVTAIIAIVIAFAVTPGSPFKAKVNNAMTATSEQLADMADRATEAQVSGNFATSTESYTADATGQFKIDCPAGQIYNAGTKACE